MIIFPDLARAIVKIHNYRILSPFENETLFNISLATENESALSFRFPQVEDGKNYCGFAPCPLYYRKRRRFRCKSEREDNYVIS